MRDKTQAYKYRIREKLHAMPTFNRKEMQRTLRKKLQWGDATWYRNLNARVDEPVNIPAEELHTIATTLGCTMEELLNTEKLQAA